MNKTILIIGAGIAGLSAGIYSQMNGFNTKIFEMHNIPGGLCTAWKRKDYTFDLCIHWISGSSPQSNVYPMWEELGLIKDRELITHEFTKLVIDKDNNHFYSYTNPDKLQQEMLQIAPEDEKEIKKFIKDVKRLGTVDFPLEMGFKTFIKMFPSLMLWRKYSLPLSEMAAKFKNPTLRNLFKQAFQWHNQTTAFSIMSMAEMGAGTSKYPIGGSKPVARALEKHYLNIGGEIAYKSRVKSIVVEKDQAVGLELMDDTIEKGDIIISAADGRSTIFDWLQGQYVDDKIRDVYQNLETYPSVVFVSLGVNYDYSDEPHTISFPLKKPLVIARKEIDRLEVRNHSFDPTLAPEGKTAFTILIETDYEFWEGLKEKRDEYLDEKQKIGDSVVNALSELYPQIGDQVEVIDVATPLTFIRYTGNWKGAYESWLFTKDTYDLNIPQTLPGLSNFYMAGQWVAPGAGLIGAARTARLAVKMLCNNEKIKFRTSIP